MFLMMRMKILSQNNGEIDMKIIYMGTPEFAVGPLRAIYEAGHEVLAVVTQPDKAKGRGKEMQACEVKEYAVSKNIPVLQPMKIKRPEAVELLKEYAADLYIVAAFGQILSQEILDIPKYGCLNIHASLLPKYRGAAPIQWSIINGEEETGVTIMQMDAGLDTGDMLLKKAVKIEEHETGQTLHDKLSIIGSELILEALKQIQEGSIKREKQDDSKSTYASMLSKEMGCIKWEMHAQEIERLIRGLNPWPSAFTYYEGKSLKIWEAGIDTSYSGERIEVPGTIIKVEKNEVYVATGSGVLTLESVQLEGKRKMSIHDFLLGNKVVQGQLFTHSR